MMNKLYNATSSPKKKVTIKDGEYSNSDLAQPRLYWSTINDYLKNILNNKLLKLKDIAENFNSVISFYFHLHIFCISKYSFLW